MQTWSDEDGDAVHSRECSEVINAQIPDAHFSSRDETGVWHRTLEQNSSFLGPDNLEFGNRVFTEIRKYRLQIARVQDSTMETNSLTSLHATRFPITLRRPL